MNRVLGLKKWMTIVVVCFVSNFAVWGIANATPFLLSNTNVSWNDFASNWSPTDIRVLESPFAFNDGAAGKIISIAFLANGGVAKGKWIYAYQVVLERGDGSITTAVLESAPAPVVIGSSNSFWTDKPFGDTRFSEFRPNGVNPTLGVYEPSTYTWCFTTGIAAGGNSVIFGYFSDRAPTTTRMNLLKGSVKLGSKPAVLTASSDEPPVLMLLSMGLLGFWVFSNRTPAIVQVSPPKGSPDPDPPPTVLAPTPEPSAFLLLSMGLWGIWRFRKRRK